MSDQKNKALAGLAMFFAGLILLIPHRIGMSRVNYIIKRYNLPISRAGLLLYKFHNNIELSLLIGCVIGGIIPLSATAYVQNDPSSGGPARDFIGGCMIIILILMLFSSILLFLIYIGGDDFGHLNAFYLTLIFLTFCDGFTNAFAFCINATWSSLYAAAIPLSGFLVTLFHNLYKFYSDKNNWDDFDYYVLFVQLVYNILTLSIALTLWAWAVYASKEWPKANNLLSKVQNFGDAKSHEADLSPIGMLAISLGTVYAFYPSIAPYSIIDFQYAAIIELWILSISSSPTLIFAILDFIPGDGSASYWPHIGPGQCTFKTSNNKHSGKGNWSSWKIHNAVNNGKWFIFYHCIWICAIPYILCIQIFMSMLHYPDCLLSCFFNNKPFRIGFISVLFNTLREAMQAGGFAGAGKQRVAYKDNANLFDTDYENIHGGIASWNKPITLFVMMFCVFTGDGYLQHYRRCCRDCWPTTGYTKYQSFFYWLHFGFKGGIKSITSSFTDLYYHNLRPQFISYA